MDDLRRAQLKAQGFEGFQTFRELRAGVLSTVPDEPGIYVVLREGDDVPTFLPASPGGHFKGKDPTVDVGQTETLPFRGAGRGMPALREIGVLGEETRPGRALRRLLRDDARTGQTIPGGRQGPPGPRGNWFIDRVDAPE